MVCWTVSLCVFLQRAVLWREEIDVPVPLAVVPLTAVLDMFFLARLQKHKSQHSNIRIDIEYRIVQIDLTSFSIIRY